MPRTTASAARARPPLLAPPTSATNRFWLNRVPWRVLAESGSVGGSSGPPADSEANCPSRHGEHHAHSHHGPSRDVNRPKLEAVDGVPDEVADAAAQMQEEGESAAEKHEAADPRPDRSLGDCIGRRAGGSGAQPDYQADGADAQDDASDAIGYR